MDRISHKCGKRGRNHTITCTSVDGYFVHTGSSLAFGHSKRRSKKRKSAM